MRLSELKAESLLELSKAGLADPKTEWRVLAEVIGGVSWATQLAKAELEIEDSLIADLRLAVSRRANHEPMSQILGFSGFYGREFRVSSHCLSPRPETELLVELGLERLAEKDTVRILDLATGSGCIGLSLVAEIKARGQAVRAVLSDISDEALDVARENCRALGLEGECEICKSDLFKDLKAEQFDLITCNPPYIPNVDLSGLDAEVRDYEPSLALDGGTDGLDFYRRLSTEAREWLKAGASLIMEHGIGQRQEILSLFVTKWPKNDTISALDDYAGIDRLIEVKRAQGEIYDESNG